MRRLILRLRLWWLAQDIAIAEECMERLRKDLPEMRIQRHDMMLALYATENDQPT